MGGKIIVCGEIPASAIVAERFVVSSHAYGSSAEAEQACQRASSWDNSYYSFPPHNPVA